MSALLYHRTAERPDIRLWLQDDDGTLINFATGYTFVLKIGHVGKTADLTKSTGITGAAGSGGEVGGTPNVTISFTSGELDTLERGSYVWQLRATTGGLDRVYQGRINLIDVIL